MPAAAPTRILIVDDEPLLLRALKKFLEKLGMTPLVAHSGAEALAMIDDCELLITDARMPGMSGLKLLAEVRKLRSKLPVIVLTAHGTISMAVEAMRCGANNFVTKPFDPAELEEVIRLTLSQPLPAAPEPRTPGVKIAQEGIGKSRPMVRLRNIIERVARSEATTLILGESGSGKGVAAREVHRLSRRASRPFVAVNCGAIPESLIEAELFGHKKGAFTGAIQTRQGHFERAHTGTLFLDEIGDLSPSVQVKLLGVLQDRQYTPVGDSKPRTTNVRVIAATHRDLEKMVLTGKFREDLFYRLNVLSMHVPPLRERENDVLLLARRFLVRAAESEGRSVADFDDDVVRCLRRYSWPGNVRELEHAITRATVLTEGDTITLVDLPPRVRSGYSAPTREMVAVAPDPELGTASSTENLDLKNKLRELELQTIQEALKKSGGNKKQAAAMLGLNRTTLIEKLKRFHS